MEKIVIKNRFTGKELVSGEYETIKECLEKNRGADLRCADLGGADLGGAYLGGADLGGADLGGAEEYSQSHNFFTELCRRQKTTYFTTHEWATIAIISIHRICWDTILQKYKNPAMRVFKKLSKAGFDEYEKYFADYMKK